MSLTLAALFTLGLSLAPPSAQARRNGIVSPGCHGCHSGGQQPELALTFDPSVWQPGETVTATVSIEAVNGATGGFYLTADSGVFNAIGGEGTAVVSDQEVVHGTLKSASGGALTFRVQWTAPAAPGGVYFELFALSANGNGKTSGDEANETTLKAAFGCEGEEYTLDFDADGFAKEGGFSVLDCGPRPGFAREVGDCNDYDANVFPGAAERCNNLDDSCDNVIDEGLSSGSTTLYEDADSDNHGALFGSTLVVEGCEAPLGFAKVNDDCNDRDPAVNPGATESCNLLDDNCDGKADEALRPECGVGMCLRRSNTCELADCTPGNPSAEICNYADDDCNGEVDEDAELCPEGQLCYFGRCREASEIPDVEVPPPSPSGMNPTVDSGSAGATASPSEAPAGGGPALTPAAPPLNTTSAPPASSSATPSAAGGSATQPSSPASSSETPDEEGTATESDDTNAGTNPSCSAGPHKPGTPVPFALFGVLAGLGFRRVRRRAQGRSIQRWLGFAALSTACTPSREANQNAPVDAMRVDSGQTTRFHDAGRTSGATPTTFTDAGAESDLAPAELHPSPLALGAGHTCALDSEGVTYCWGSNADGQLGDGTTEPKRAQPAAVQTLGSATSVAAGSYHSCALLSDGTVACWGWNVSGQIGDGSSKNRYAPYVVEGLSDVVGVAVGSYHSCAVLPDGTARCWGQNDYGQLGNGSRENIATPSKVFALPKTAALSAAGRRTCALLQDGTVQCWGNNEFGEIGDGSTETRVFPTPVVGLDGVIGLASGFNHNCALLSDGTVWCWGSNYYGQLGSDVATVQLVPAKVAALENVKRIAAGYNHTCALTGDTLLCWGWNAGGQLGDSDTMDHRLPTPVPGLYGIQAVSGGGFHTCARLAEDVACWGSNDSGQLGSVEEFAPGLINFTPI